MISWLILGVIGIGLYQFAKTKPILLVALTIIFTLVFATRLLIRFSPSIAQNYCRVERFLR